MVKYHTNRQVKENRKQSQKCNKIMKINKESEKMELHKTQKNIRDIANNKKLML